MTNMKKMLAGGLAAGAAVCACAAPLRLMSYNVCHCKGVDGRVDCARTAAAIAKEKPDFAGLQEVDAGARRSRRIDEPAELARLSGMHATFAKAIDMPKGGEYGVAVLSREKPIRAVQRPLPGPEPRVLLLCEFKDCWFGTTHLDSRTVKGDPAPAHVLSVPIIREEIEKCLAGGKPVFLTGDWNATPNEAGVVAKFGEFMEILNDTSKPTNGNLTRCIDYIAADRAHAARFEVRKRRVVPDLETSDHKPVVVDLAAAGG